MPQPKSFMRVRLYKVARPTKETPTPTPVEIPGFTIDTRDHDVAQRKARERLREQGYEVRSMNFLADPTGEHDMAAVVYEKEPRS